ncbi:hypothetical protein [Pseudomonas fluorescens]|uniref:hypothetical protein n=1 Tax=Pseudomonas fluorescens TaxID=294 RepID=UPI0012FE593E|nr:hypothetical protein [Pseudomonas fluorescens]
MKLDDHNRLIKHAARSELKPIDCAQKGQSRTWLDDHNWWVGVVEFQPHSVAKGSYLNVGACWLWHEKDYLSFDDGHRVEPFNEYLDSQKFREAAQSLAKRAKEEVLNLRLKYPSIHACAKHLRAQAKKNDWVVFNSAVAAGLSGDIKLAEEQFSQILRQECRATWQINLQSRAALLSAVAHDADCFKSEIIGAVSKCRTLLGLPTIESEGMFS